MLEGGVARQAYLRKDVEASWLTCCVLKNDEKGVIRNLGYGISPTTLDRYGQTALHAVSSTRNESIKSILLAAISKDEIDVRDEFQNTPLHSAAYRGREDVMTLLIASGADQTLKDFWGLTATQILQKTRERERENANHRD